MSPLILLSAFWLVNVLKGFTLSSVLFIFILSPVLLLIANYFYEGFRVVIDADKTRLTIHRWHRYKGRVDLHFECSLADLKEFQVERSRSTSRILLKINEKKVALTNSYDNSGRQEKLAKEIINWLQMHGYNLKLNS